MTSVSFFFPSIHSFTMLFLLKLIMRTFILNQISIIDPLLSIWCHSSLGNKVVSIINLNSSTKYYGINLKIESENSKWHQMKVKAKRKKKSALEASRRFERRSGEIGTRSISKILDTMGCARSSLESSRCFSPLPALHP